MNVRAHAMAHMDTPRTWCRVYAHAQLPLEEVDRAKTTNTSAGHTTFHINNETITRIG